MTEQPARTAFAYTFENITKVVGRFTDVLGLKQFAIYVFDYGAPVGFRLALAHPDRITAIVSQNGNTYLEGVSEAFAPIQAYWNEPTKPTVTPCAASWPRRPPSFSTPTE